MNTILLPIRKEYCDKIFSGEKKFEFRKKTPASEVSKILIYESRGCGMVVGEITIESIIRGSVKEVWDSTHAYAGIEYDKFMEYFNGRNEAIAYKIAGFKKYEKALPLSSFGLSSAPQNYVWII